MSSRQELFIFNKREILGMSQQKDDPSGAALAGSDQSHRNDEEDELEAEQESAEAMDAEVPQPPQEQG
ncbi:MAG: hypothetical protein AUG51_15625 [Acidobacteria bacterium 13_1_20CM_3_53_8]|nr:MAG: hypothetical protein AUG51_15625 [Acidobacteria bacterium 13_1_20CM_3_53_8]